MDWLIAPAYAQGGAPSSGGLDILLLIIPMFLIMYFLIIRPQQKRQKEQKAMVAALAKGDKVMLQSGIIGKVIRAPSESQEIEVEIAAGTVITMVRDGVSVVIEKRGAKTKSEEDKDSKVKKEAKK